MADDAKNAGDTPEVALDLDEQTPDLDAAMREAVAAVEEVEAGNRPADSAANGGNAGHGGAEEVTRLRQEIADLRDRSVRTLADFDNFRKRAERERQEQRRYALLEPLRELLTVADNLDLALSAQGSAEDLKRGVEMIHRQMQDLLRRFVRKAVIGMDNSLTQPVLFDLAFGGHLEDCRKSQFIFFRPE